MLILDGYLMVKLDGDLMVKLFCYLKLTYSLETNAGPLNNLLMPSMHHIYIYHEREIKVLYNLMNWIANNAQSTVWFVWNSDNMKQIFNKSFS